MVSGTSEVWQVWVGSLQSGLGLALPGPPGAVASTSDEVSLKTSSAS